MSSVKYIKSSSANNQRNIKEYSLFGEIMVVVVNKFTEDYDLKSILKRIENNIPRHLFEELDIIYIGRFKELLARQVESVYMDGAIYLSSEQPSEENIYNSIIHELAHSVEKVYESDLYGDDTVLEEFLNKRIKLRNLLEANNLYCDATLYLRPELTKDFDNFLFKTVGYDRLSIITSNLFISPYSVTSLREYFASGFEHYFTNENPEFIKNISPSLYKKIIFLTKN